MTRLYTVILAYLLVTSQIWTTIPVHALSYAVCVGANDVSVFKTVFGFQLWTNSEMKAQAYVSSTRNDRSTKMENDGWSVTPFLDVDSAPGYPLGLIRGVNVENTQLKINHKFEQTIQIVCRYTHADRFRGLSLICAEHHFEPGWHKQLEDQMYFLHNVE
ncbi:hypothetical protein BGZ94_000017 [Podila epigama]|nr:hypothetical protein BGZ94_000017 [Podila epigama]